MLYETRKTKGGRRTLQTGLYSHFALMAIFLAHVMKIRISIALTQKMA